MSGPTVVKYRAVNHVCSTCGWILGAKISCESCQRHRQLQVDVSGKVDTVEVETDESLPDAPYTEQTTDPPRTDYEIRALLHRVANRLDHLVAILEKELGR